MPKQVIRAVSGGDKLEAALQFIARNLKKGKLEVGFLEGATYETGESVPMIAAIHEFGAPRRGIPPRPFMRPAFKEHSEEWPDKVADQLKKAHYDSHVVLNRMGAVIKGEIQQSIRDVQGPPLSEVTLMVRQIVGPNGKGTFADVLEARRRVAAGERASNVSNKPLVWTSHLLHSVDWKVSD